MFNQINEVYEKKNLNGAKEVMIKTEELVTAIKKLKKDDLKMLRKGKVEASFFCILCQNMIQYLQRRSSKSQIFV